MLAAPIITTLNRCPKGCQNPGQVQGALPTAPAVEQTGFTVLGKYPGYIQTALLFSANYLSTKNWSWSVNVKFLNDVIKRRDVILLSENAFKATGTFKDEIEYLKRHGYKIVQEGWRLIPPIK